jgi:hypothetical protein
MIVFQFSVVNIIKEVMKALLKESKLYLTVPTTSGS